MKVGFIGAGKVGFSLGKYFKDNNLNVIGIYNRSYSSGEEAAKFINIRYFNNLEEIVLKSDIIFLTVSDKSIAEVWDNIKTFNISNKIICHCSGALNSSVFTGIEKLNAWGYSLHPVLAINNKLSSYKNLKKSYFTLEGSNNKLNTMKNLINQLGNEVIIISQQNKVLYHCATVFASNFIVALAQISKDLLQKCGLREEESSLLFPLMEASIKNIINEGSINALTGPVERCDIGTVSNHLLNLKGNERQLYILLSEELVKIAEIKNTHINYEDLKIAIKE